MQTVTANNITIINFGMGSAMCATIMDLLSAIHPKAVLFLGKCGGLKKMAVSAAIRAHVCDYWTGSVYSTNRRVWEHDDKFKQYLTDIKSTAIDMETATLFTVGFANKIPRGALLLVSDNPMVPEGVKTSKSDESVTVNYVALQLSIGIQALNELRDSGDSVKHMRFE